MNAKQIHLVQGGFKGLVEKIIYRAQRDGDEFMSLLPSITSADARRFLGDDFFSPEEMMAAYGWHYTEAQLASFGETMPDFKTLFWLRQNGYVLMAGPPQKQNLVTVCEAHDLRFRDATNEWFDKFDFRFVYNDYLAAGQWLALRKEPYPFSFLESVTGQKKLVQDFQCVPNVAELVFVLTAYYKLRGIHLLADVWVKTSSTDSMDNQAVVGYYAKDGLGVNLDGTRRYVRLGVASSLKCSLIAL